MNHIISGIIHKVDNDGKIIYLKVRKKLVAFYLQRSLVKQFGRYLNAGIYLSLKSEDEAKIIAGKKVFIVEYFLKIAYNRKIRQEVFYSMEVIKEGIKDFINTINHRLYLDIEMTMQNFYQKSRFVQEVIQVGYILEDNNQHIIAKEGIYIKPKRYPILNERTKKFLNISQNTVDNGISPVDFATKLQNIIIQYNPTIIVWGANDFLGLTSMYELNKIKYKLDKNNFLDLLKIHKNYFNLKHDLGLFKALEMYEKSYEKNVQSHNALEDADVTRIIFHNFKKIIND